MTQRFDRIPELEGLAPEVQRQLCHQRTSSFRASWRGRLLALSLWPAVLAIWFGIFWFSYRVCNYFEITGLLRLAIFMLAALLAFVVLPRALSRVLDPLLLRPWLRSHLPYLSSTCGYDLTANTSGVCPECGREIDKPPADDTSKLSGQ